MRKLAANLLLLLVCSPLVAQTEFKTYSWEEAKGLNPDSVLSITFEKEKLDSIPLELMKFIHLKKLDLSKNKLVDLPAFFIQFQELEILDLGKNSLVNFPLELCQLTQLKRLILNRNDFAYIPDCISNLNNLAHLDLWDTPVATFPETMTSMKNLKTIDVRGVLHGPKYQQKWKEKLSWVKIEFDAPCNCFE